VRFSSEPHCNMMDNHQNQKTEGLVSLYSVNRTCWRAARSTTIAPVGDPEVGKQLSDLSEIRCVRSSPEILLGTSESGGPDAVGRGATRHCPSKCLMTTAKRLETQNKRYQTGIGDGRSGGCLREVCAARNLPSGMTI
jgi:hypothetical protein